MIKQKPILLVSTLFAIAMITITAYATAAATDTTPVNYSTKINTTDSNLSDKYTYGNHCTHSAWLHYKLNTSSTQIRIMGNNSLGLGNNYNHTWIEIKDGNEWQTWNYTEYFQQKEDNDFDTMLTGPKPVNISKKEDVTPILDAIGQQEAQFDDVQHVTIYGIDDASVIDTYGYGDCWADSCWLYNKLTNAGIPVRIMGYVDGGNGDGWRHTWIEVNVGNGWQTWNYTKYSSKHAGDNGYGTPFVLIEPGNAPADVMRTGY